MADRAGAGRRSDSGFTLIELVVAMAVLMGGVTALVALLTVGVSARQRSEMRQRAVWLSDRVFQEVALEAFENPWLEDTPLEIPSRGPVPAEDTPGMTWSADFHVDPRRPDLVLVELRVRWAEQGEGVQQTFRRLMRRQEPFPRRAARLLAGRGYRIDPENDR